MLSKRIFSTFFLGVVTLFAIGLPSGSCATMAFDCLSPQERDMKTRWISAKFDGQAKEVARPESCLEVIENHDPVFLDNRGGRKLQIAGKQYDRGLYCHAPSRINVFLPSPAKRFIGVVGIDTNAVRAPVRFVFTSESAIVNSLQPTFFTVLKKASKRTSILAVQKILPLSLTTGATESPATSRIGRTLALSLKTVRFSI